MTVQSLGAVGAGRTGSGTAHVFALAGHGVLINAYRAPFSVAGLGNRFRKWGR